MTHYQSSELYFTRSPHAARWENITSSGILIAIISKFTVKEVANSQHEMGVASSYRISVSDSVFSNNHCMPLKSGALSCSIVSLVRPAVEREKHEEEMSSSLHRHI